MVFPQEDTSETESLTASKTADWAARSTQTLLQQQLYILLLLRFFFFCLFVNGEEMATNGTDAA